jgi:anti-sigma B factor antagonist
VENDALVSEWSERHVGDVLVIDLKGGLTIGNQELRERFDEVLERGEKKLLVNLAQVPYMDSTSVGDLIVGHLQAAKHGAELKLLNLQPRILELLTMHHLIQVFEHYDDEDAALASFGG